MENFNKPLRALGFIQLEFVIIFSYQTLHFFFGFIGLPFGHLKSSEKSLLLDNGPIMRNSPGECTPVFMASLNESSRHFTHQTWPKLTQKSCFGVKSCPGSICSCHSPSWCRCFWSSTHWTIKTVKVLFRLWMIYVKLLMLLPSRLVISIVTNISLLRMFSILHLFREM